MVQILILAVLVIIALLLAPWLIGVALAAVALYGIYVVIAAAITGLILTIGFVWFLLTSINRKSPGEETAPIVGGRVSCPSCQAEISDRLVVCDNCGARL